MIFTDWRKLIFFGVLVGAVFIVLGILSYAIDIVSRIAQTLDKINSTTILVGYVATVAALISVVAVLAYVTYIGRGKSGRIRRASSSPKSLRRRVDEFYETHRLGESEPVARHAQPVLSDGTLKVAVCGVQRVGKSSLLRALQKSFASGPAAAVDCKELPQLGVDQTRNAEILNAVATGALVLFVIDQDLRDYEFNAIQDALRAGHALIVVVNKADRKSKEELAETVTAITKKLDKIVNLDDIVSVSADPLALLAVGTDQGAAVEPAPDVDQLVRRLRQMLG